MTDRREKRESKSTAAKIVTALAVGVLLGLGLCGVGAAVGDHFPTIADRFYELGIATFLASLFGLVVACLFMFLFGLEKRDR